MQSGCRVASLTRLSGIAAASSLSLFCCALGRRCSLARANPAIPFSDERDLAGSRRTPAAGAPIRTGIYRDMGHLRRRCVEILQDFARPARRGPPAFSFTLRKTLCSSLLMSRNERRCQHVTPLKAKRRGPRNTGNRRLVVRGAVLASRYFFLASAPAPSSPLA